MNKPEPVAEVCSGWTLRWIGAEPIAHLLARHPGVRIGTFLYEADAINAQLLAALKLIDARLRACMKYEITAAEAYDSHYQAEVAEAIRAAEGGA